MRSSLVLGVTLLLTIAVTSIVQARTIKSEHTCGSLGPGTNACKCEEIVVKAAKVQKPLVYASPEAINEAALARQVVAKLSVATGSHSNPISGCRPHSSGIISTSSSSSSSSNSRYSTSSSSASSSIGYLGGGSYSSFNPILDDVSSSSGCGCGKKFEPLEARDLLSSNTDKQIVPSFPPIGDLCYPHKVESSKLRVTTKVTPAYPSKITCSSPTAEKVCVNVYNGQIDAGDLNKLSLATASSSAASGGLFGKLNGASAFANANSLGRYTSSHAGSHAAQYGNFGGYSNSGSAGYSSLGSLGGYTSSSSVGYGSSGNVGGYGSTGYSAYGSGYAGYDGYAGYAGSQAGTTGQLNSQISSYGTYGNKFGALNNVEVTRGSAGSSNCDFGDYSELPQDYSYPQLPADPVSLSLAYKNIFPRLIVDKNKAFVAEDKLAFGHRTIPSETVFNKKKLDVPEEKLQILDKPVVELKPIPLAPITVPVYNEQEEAKLAELEAIERESINQEEIAAEQHQGNFITYGDLGYAPVNAVLTNKWSQSTDSINTLDAEDNVEGCAPVGPPTPDYVPGNVLINQEIVKNDGEEDGNYKDENVYVHYYEDGRSFEEDDPEDSTSGIFARLRSSAKKYGLPCGVA